MSENPLRDIDTEMAAVTRSFGAAAMMMTHRMGPQMSQAAQQRRGLRQTKPPSARQLRRMSQGQLTNYMWRTHARGMNGTNVAAESALVSKELDRRGLVGQKQEWEQLANVRQDHLGGARQESSNQQPTQQNTADQQETARLAAEREAQSQSRQQQTQNQGQPQQDANLPADIAASLTAVTAGVATADLLADTIDDRVAELGGDPAHEGADLDSTATQSGDLAATGAPDEAVEAGDFGAEAVSGDLGQAMSDELGDSSPSPENTNEASAEQPVAEAGVAEA